MINVYNAPDERTAPLFANAFAAGFPDCNIGTKYRPGVWAGFGSPQTWDTLLQAIRAGDDFYYGDHAYFGRHIYYRITKNAFQHRGQGHSDLNKLRNLGIRARPWKRGSKIILCEQSEGYHERMGCPNWGDDTLKKLTMVSDRNIVRRTKKSGRSLKEDLADAWCVVTHTSNAAVEAILAGVPAICTGDCAASIMSLRDPLNVEHPFYPDGREEWAAVLADNQWTFAEIANGDAWRHLNEKI